MYLSFDFSYPRLTSPIVSLIIYTNDLWLNAEHVSTKPNIRTTARLSITLSASTSAAPSVYDRHQRTNIAMKLEQTSSVS